MRCLTNQLAVEDRYLHRMAVKAAKAIPGRVSKEPGFAAVAIRGLIGTSGTLNFDQATKTKTVEKIVAEADHEALEEIVPFFEQLIRSPEQPTRSLLLPTASSSPVSFSPLCAPRHLLPKMTRMTSRQALSNFCLFSCASRTSWMWQGSSAPSLPSRRPHRSCCGTA